MKTFFSPEATVKPVCQIPDMCQITIPDVSAWSGLHGSGFSYQILQHSWGHLYLHTLKSWCTFIASTTIRVLCPALTYTLFTRTRVYHSKQDHILPKAYSHNWGSCPLFSFITQFPSNPPDICNKTDYLRPGRFGLEKDSFSSFLGWNSSRSCNSLTSLADEASSYGSVRTSIFELPTMKQTIVFLILTFLAILRPASASAEATTLPREAAYIILSLILLWGGQVYINTTDILDAIMLSITGVRVLGLPIGDSCCPSNTSARLSDLHPLAEVENVRLNKKNEYRGVSSGITLVKSPTAAVLALASSICSFSIFTAW